MPFLSPLDIVPLQPAMQHNDNNNRETSDLRELAFIKKFLFVMYILHYFMDLNHNPQFYQFSVVIPRNEHRVSPMVTEKPFETGYGNDSRIHQLVGFLKILISCNEIVGASGQCTGYEHGIFLIARKMDR